MNLEKLKRYRNRQECVEDVKNRAYGLEVSSHGCCQVVIQAFLDVLGEKNDALFKAASPFAAGMSLTGNNCGALIGGLMILGTVYGRGNLDEGKRGIIKGIGPSRKMVRYFSDGYSSLDCRDITGTDLADREKSEAFFSSGGLEKCAGIVADVSGFVAGMLYDEYEINQVARGPGT